MIAYWWGVPMLFYTDGHHKLVRWHFVTHCAIDGYSRLVLFLKCSNNNRASTVYDSFLQSVQQYGLPSRVRCDQGGENMLVAHHMIHHRGSVSRKFCTQPAHWKTVEGHTPLCYFTFLLIFKIIFLSTMGISIQLVILTCMLFIICRAMVECSRAK